MVVWRLPICPGERAASSLGTSFRTRRESGITVGWAGLQTGQHDTAFSIDACGKPVQIKCVLLPA
jgi:hypothetical protein